MNVLYLDWLAITVISRSKRGRCVLFGFRKANVAIRFAVKSVRIDVIDQPRSLAVVIEPRLICIDQRVLSSKYVVDFGFEGASIRRE